MVSYMEKKIDELINPDGTLIHGKTPVLDPNVTAKHTTDRGIKSRTQPFMFGAYRRYYLQEKELQHTPKADEFKDKPEEFHKYLTELGESESFEDYFEKHTDVKEALNNVSRIKASEVIEQILAKAAQDIDIIEKQPDVDIDSITNKEPILIGKLLKLAEYFNKRMSDTEKRVILNYFTNKLKNG